jgi:hypothetical protein
VKQNVAAPSYLNYRGGYWYSAHDLIPYSIESKITLNFGNHFPLAPLSIPLAKPAFVCIRLTAQYRHLNQP